MKTNNMKTKSEKQQVIKEAVNKGFISIKESGYDNYPAAKQFLELSSSQRLKLNVMAQSANLY